MITQLLPPRIVLFASFFIATLGTIPFAVIAWTRSAPSPGRPIHIIQDMDYQPRFDTQTVNPLFADDRAMRPQIPGVVAVGQSGDDVHFSEGVVDGGWATTVPSGVPVTMDILKRGRERFNIYCSMCHGYAGFGDGIVNQRAMKAMANADGPIYGTAWVQAKSLHDPEVVDQPVGQIFNTITHGIRNMAGYGAQIPPRDRWTIAAYVKALQKSQDAMLQDVPPQERSSLNP
jgi:mono/diheme cytochrome c family protein